ncbi:MAG TPA: hypothetical protein VL475_03470, partial [Planctomycetaceae bacterium]|nr:hypothetical protein [Planctomycetaceae bacterium]
MSSITRTYVIQIRNSQDLRIPKVLLEQVQLSGMVELELRHNEIVIRPARKVRRGWESQFRR